MAKPYKFNDKKREQFVKFLREGYTITAASKAMGITRQTYYEAASKIPEFAAEVHQARDQVTEIIEDSLYKQALDGNTTATIFWLCNRAPHRWRHVQKIEVDNVTDLRQRLRCLSDEEFRRLANSDG